jgi:hypothetical protein
MSAKEMFCRSIKFEIDALMVAINFSFHLESVTDISFPLPSFYLIEKCQKLEFVGVCMTTASAIS